jgi:hypothetical protein
MLRSPLLQQYWNSKHQMVFMKKCDNAALCNRKVNKEKRRRPLYFLSDAGQSAQLGAGASYNTKAGNSDTGIP